MRTFLSLGCYLIAKGCLLIGWKWIALGERIAPTMLEPEPDFRQFTVEYDVSPLTVTNGPGRTWVYRPEEPKVQ